MSKANEFVRSWADTQGNVSSTESLLEWVKNRNETVRVEIHKISLDDDPIWHYDPEQGVITNPSGTFFTIAGCRMQRGGELFCEQPIILQQEIGYLGIICKEIDGTLNFLMQAKIEPGNINKIQISPTIQATKSNFTQKHGGRKPAYLDYFLHADRYEIIVDQIQSEQSSRFYQKRNRNIIIRVEDDIEVLPSYRWMTLGQIKRLMRYDNLVNMDTRTVLSCIPFSLFSHPDAEKNGLRALFRDQSLFRSVFEGDGENHLPRIYQYLNNYKMFDESECRIVALNELKSWEMRNGEFICRESSSFKVIFCDISIEGREVKHWTQPLFQAIGQATFGLIMCEENGVKKFLVKAMPEIGCFDRLELGPTVQMEPTAGEQCFAGLDRFFEEKRREERYVRYQAVLSEEGGRFYHEQNHNIILELPMEEMPQLPEGYFLIDYKTLNSLVQVNNCLNIQLRNLLSLLEV